ncbi:MAG: hypothetical protein U0V72_11480 [Cytophagales bacterium]
MNLKNMTSKNKLKLCFGWALVWMCVLSSCDIKKNKDQNSPESNFQKIYDHPHFIQNQKALRVLQNAQTGEYVILSRLTSEASNFGLIHLLKTDKSGNFIAEKVLGSELVAPLAQITSFNNGYLIFAMNATTLETVMLQIDQNLELTNTTSLAGTSYPLAVHSFGNGFLLQYYNREDKQTVIAQVSSSGQLTNEQSFSVGSDPYDPEPRILKHLTGMASPLPFDVNSFSGKIYFSGFFNYSFSGVFFNFGQTGLPGVIQGYNDESGILTLEHLESGNFGIAHFSANQVAVNPKFSYNTNTISTVNNVGGYTLIDLNMESPIRCVKTSIDSKNILLFAGSTPNNYVTLYLYNASSGQLIKNVNLGYGNKHKLSDLYFTQDGGAVLCGTTYVSGKLPRTFLYKYTAAQVKEWVQ